MPPKRLRVELWDGSIKVVVVRESVVTVKGLLHLLSSKVPALASMASQSDAAVAYVDPANITRTLDSDGDVAALFAADGTPVLKVGTVGSFPTSQPAAPAPRPQPPPSQPLPLQQQHPPNNQDTSQNMALLSGRQQMRAALALASASGPAGRGPPSSLSHPLPSPSPVLPPSTRRDLRDAPTNPPYPHSSSPMSPPPSGGVSPAYPYPPGSHNLPTSYPPTPTSTVLSLPRSSASLSSFHGSVHASQVDPRHPSLSRSISSISSSQGSAYGTYQGQPYPSAHPQQLTSAHHQQPAPPPRPPTPQERTAHVMQQLAERMAAQAAQAAQNGGSVARRSSMRRESAPASVAASSPSTASAAGPAAPQPSGPGAQGAVNGAGAAAAKPGSSIKRLRVDHWAGSSTVIMRSTGVPKTKDEFVRLLLLKVSEFWAVGDPSHLVVAWVDPETGDSKRVGDEVDLEEMFDWDVVHVKVGRARVTPQPSLPRPTSVAPAAPEFPVHQPHLTGRPLSTYGAPSPTPTRPPQVPTRPLSTFQDSQSSIRLPGRPQTNGQVPPPTLQPSPLAPNPRQQQQPERGVLGRAGSGSSGGSMVETGTVGQNGHVVDLRDKAGQQGSSISPAVAALTAQAKDQLYPTPPRTPPPAGQGGQQLDEGRRQEQMMERRQEQGQGHQQKQPTADSKRQEPPRHQRNSSVGLPAPSKTLPPVPQEREKERERESRDRREQQSESPAARSRRSSSKVREVSAREASPAPPPRRRRRESTEGSQVLGAPTSGSNRQSTREQSPAPASRTQRPSRDRSPAPPAPAKPDPRDSQASLDVPHQQMQVGRQGSLDRPRPISRSFSPARRPEGQQQPTPRFPLARQGTDQSFQSTGSGSLSLSARHSMAMAQLADPASVRASVASVASWVQEHAQAIIPAPGSVTAAIPSPTPGGSVRLGGVGGMRPNSEYGGRGWDASNGSNPPGSGQLGMSAVSRNGSGSFRQVPSMGRRGTEHTLPTPLSLSRGSVSNMSVSTMSTESDAVGTPHQESKSPRANGNHRKSYVPQSPADNGAPRAHRRFNSAEGPGRRGSGAEDYDVDDERRSRDEEAPPRRSISEPKSPMAPRGRQPAASVNLSERETRRARGRDMSAVSAPGKRQPRERSAPPRPQSLNSYGSASTYSMGSLSGRKRIPRGRPGMVPTGMSLPPTTAQAAEPEAAQEEEKETDMLKVDVDGRPVGVLLEWKKDDTTYTTEELMGEFGREDWGRYRNWGFKMARKDEDSLSVTFIPRKRSLKTPEASGMDRLKITFFCNNVTLYRSAITNFPRKVESISVKEFRSSFIRPIRSLIRRNDGTYTTNTTQWASFLLPRDQSHGDMHIAYVVKDSAEEFRPACKRAIEVFWRHEGRRQD
ncbi:hypothetical protein M427DRAFT_162284 [Gonapodya prolifera JEL478]|uniref:Uncharacterized protein n=1 Tax=Gonapodya prolifera (strain JEL478) TaxID=1344416 RepID=A0A139AZX6_GONPJ|nr:hypothetical protein M427DRAFT_162284 [Gonapodya prolifera JEL478]|eukprot:KXS22025.1 hypothetical protein M427DRAFT_162284 [Gonapodya prolifera JEL478]